MQYPVKFLIFIIEKNQDSKKDAANYYITVCHIKNRKINQVEIAEIHYVIPCQTIDQISDGAGCQKDRTYS